jgi:serine/threonine protein kinase
VDECGSRGYTAPEVLLCHPYGVEVDMFSVGVILFIVLSGYRPFAGGNRNDVKRRIVQGEYSLDSQRWNRVSEMAKNLVRGLLVERRHRLTAHEAVQHEWFNDDPQSIAILEQSNLNDNAVLIPISPDEEPLLSHHSGTSVCIFVLFSLSYSLDSFRMLHSH